MRVSRIRDSRPVSVKEELYQGTSKGAEGYAARLTFKQAKDDGMNVAVQWQDADSSSSKAVTDHFPNAEVMICAGHATRAHKKRLESFAVKKRFSAKFKGMNRKKFPLVDEVVCHCTRHKAGCGCLSKGFIERARNNFSLILSTSGSAEEFARSRPYHDMPAMSIHGMEEFVTFIHLVFVVVASVRMGSNFSAREKTITPEVHFAYSSHF